MALAKDNLRLASDFVALKARVKAEMLRRKYVGSLVTYGGVAYDYTVAPSAGNVVGIEHINKLVTPLNAIRPTGYTTESVGNVTDALTNLNTFLTQSEGYSITGATTNCAANCAGLCVGTCNIGCTGCTGCSGCTSCTSCTSCSGCSGSCVGGCRFTCSTSCVGSCQGAGRLN